MVDVFISYKREERANTLKIARKLESLGLSVWFDDKIANGTTFDAQIDAALHAAKAILVMWSPESVRSDWVRNEAAFGLQRGNLVTIMTASCELPLAFRSTQYEPIFDQQFKDDHPGWIKVVERIKDLTERRSEVETFQGRRRRSKKLNRTLQWLIAWVLATIMTLSLGSFLLDYGEIRPGPYAFHGNWPGDEDIASKNDFFQLKAEGTWELINDIPGDKIASDRNFVQIICESNWGECIQFNSHIIRYVDTPTLESFVDRHAIVQWTDRLIVAETEGACFTFTLTINRDTQSVLALRTRPTETGDSLACSGFLEDAAVSQRTDLRLVDGRRQDAQRRTDKQRLILAFVAAALVLATLYTLVRIILLWRAKL